MATIRGGEKLEAALAEMSKKLSKAATLRVGFLENATYPDGKQVAEIAAHNEYGTPNAAHPIPPRPFFRNMIAAKSPEWPGAMGKLLAANNYDVDKSMRLTGEGIKGQLQQSIRDTNSPPLSEVTIKAKGFDKPLIDTSNMINSVAYDVKS